MAWRNNPADINSITPTRGLDMATAMNGVRPLPGMWHTGSSCAQLSTDGVNSTPVVTEIYVAAVNVMTTTLVTGISIFNGTVVATDKYKVALFDVLGNLVRTSAAAGFQPTTADSYENVAFALGPDGVTAATTVVLPGPATYFVGVIYNGTTNRFNAHGVGAFPTIRVTGAVFATAFNTTSLTLATIPSVFTVTDLPPIASLY